MASLAPTVFYGIALNTYTGITDVINGTLNIGGNGDHAWNTGGTNSSQGSLFIIGNGQVGTQALALDNGNNIPNNTTTVVNNTGTLTIGITAGTGGSGDAVGSFILNGGAWQQVSQNWEGSLVVLPSAIPSTVSGANVALARTGVGGAGYNIVNVFAGAGAAAGNELNISAQLTTGSTGSGFVVTKIGAGTLTYSGSTANTYIEPTIVNEGTLVLAKTAAVNALSGALIVGDFNGTDTVRVTQNVNQFPTAQPIFVNSSGSFILANGTATTQTISTLDVRGGSVQTGVNTLQTNNTITGQPVNTTGATVVGGTSTGNLLLTGTPTFNTADLGPIPGLLVAGPISGSVGLTKTGAGTLVLSGTTANTYTGVTTVSAGNLYLQNSGGVAIPANLT